MFHKHQTALITVTMIFSLVGAVTGIGAYANKAVKTEVRTIEVTVSPSPSAMASSASPSASATSSAKPVLHVSNGMVK